MKQQKPEQQDTPVWDSVEATRVNCCAFFTLPASIIPFVRNEKLNQYADMVKVHEKVTLLDKDVAAFREKLVAISERHTGKTGAAANANEHMNALEIAEAYMNWSTSYESVVLTNLEDIAGLYADAEARLAQAGQNQDTGDVEAALAAELATDSVEPGIEVDSINEVLTPQPEQDTPSND